VGPKANQKVGKKIKRAAVTALDHVFENKKTKGFSV